MPKPYDKYKIQKVLDDYLRSGNLHITCKKHNITENAFKLGLERNQELKTRYDSFVIERKKAMAEQQQRIVSEYLQGKTCMQISEEYHLHKSTVSLLIRRFKVAVDKKDSLCWYCERSAKFIQYPCSWAHKFIPVERWTADQCGDSYNVRKCPIYLPLERRDK